MKKVAAYILSIAYYFLFGMLLLVFHPIQWLCLKIGGYLPHKKSVDILNFFLVKILYVLGVKINFSNPYKVPINKPVIVVSNHQSMNDITLLIWYMRKYHLKFVSKKELGKGIPSISFNLKYGGSALIDRKDPKQAIAAIASLGKYIEKNDRGAVIFPEGTRSKNGVPKKFHSNGLKTLIENAPSSYVLPVSINNSYKLLKYGGFPMNLGVNLKIEVHKPIEATSIPFEELFANVEKQIKSKIIV